MSMSVRNAPSISRQSLSSTYACHFFAPHGPFVQTDVQRMRFSHRTFAQDRADDRYLRTFGQVHQLVLQAEAMDLDASQHHRLLAVVEEPRRFGDGFSQGSRDRLRARPGEIRKGRPARP